MKMYRDEKTSSSDVDFIQMLNVQIFFTFIRV